MSNYDQLFADALADVENQHACRTTDECFMQGGCPKCLSAVVRSQQPLDVAQIDVFEGAGIVRFTMTQSCEPESKPCVVFFKTRLKVHRKAQ